MAVAVMMAPATGRTYVYQWDLNQQLSVTGDVTEIHFAQPNGPTALVMPVENGLAAIPNILLQNSGTLTAYAYTPTRTLTTQSWKIIARQKPDDYVYTPTEVKTWGTIEAEAANAIAIAQGVRTDLDTLTTDVAADRAAAETAAAAAARSESNAAGSATAALASKNEVGVSAGNAANSAAAALVSQNAAKTSEANAKTSENNAAAILENAVTKTGDEIITGNKDFSGNITAPNLVQNTAQTFTDTQKQIARENIGVYYVADTSDTANAIVITVPNCTSYVDGAKFLIKIKNTNTSTTATLNVNGIGAKSVIVPAVGDLVANSICEFVYNSTADNFNVHAGNSDAAKLGGYTPDHYANASNTESALSNKPDYTINVSNAINDGSLTAAYYPNAPTILDDSGADELQYAVSTNTYPNRIFRMPIIKGHTYIFACSIKGTTVTNCTWTLCARQAGTTVMVKHFCNTTV